MQDLTQYSDDELSLVVFNTEDLYLLRHDIDLLLGVLNEAYLYTDIQKDILIQDIEQDYSEGL